MASGGVMTHPQDVRSLSMKSDKLAVQGTGITPRAITPTPTATSTSDTALLPAGLDPTSSKASSRVSVTSEELEDEEANSMLQGVVTMNQVLEGQIEALRLRLTVEDRQQRTQRVKLVQDKDAVIAAKEGEIDDLRDSLHNRDDRIQTLVKASQEKDKTIDSKVTEIDELKKLVKQTEDVAHKLHKQIGRVHSQKQSLETDTLYSEQNSEIARLNVELSELKQRLSAMEQELQRASSVIREQSDKILSMEQERGTMHDKFREELDKATKAMRQEVERMREVMRQNYDEMRQLRAQNQQMHSDVRDIKQLLLAGRGPPPATSSPSPRLTGVQRPLTASPAHLFKTHAEHYSPAPSPRRPAQGVRGARQGVGGGAGGGPYSLKQSAAEPARTASRGGPHAAGRAGGSARAAAKPAVCSFKDAEPPRPGLPAISGPAAARQPAAVNATAAAPGLQRNKSSLRLSTGKGARK